MKIIHISDLHFGYENQDIVQAFLNDLSVIAPDLIIISGDLTQRATTEQYQLFKQFINNLPAKVLVVPGNHDIPLYNQLMRWVMPFKRYKKYISPSLESSFENEQVRILGVNSVDPFKLKNGRLASQVMARIKYYFSTSTNQLGILFFHHNFNYFSGMHSPLENSEEFIQFLKDSPIHMVCTGHLHYSNLTLLKKNDGYPCTVLHAGSLCCQRSKDRMNSYYVMDTNNLMCVIDWRVFDESSFKSHATYPIDFQIVHEQQPSVELINHRVN